MDTLKKGVSLIREEGIEAFVRSVSWHLRWRLTLLRWAVLRARFEEMGFTVERYEEGGDRLMLKARRTG